MPWIRFPIWDRWRELTRFHLACEMALDAYKSYFEAFPVMNSDAIKIRDPSGSSKFSCSYTNFLTTLKDNEQLYRVLLPSYIALLEEHGRNLIEEMITRKNVPPSVFGRRSSTATAAQIAEAYIRKTNVETWGNTILVTCGRNWSYVNPGLNVLVEAFVVRNLIAHGLLKYNQSAINRIAGLGAGPLRVTVGQGIALNKVRFQEYIVVMRSFGRGISGAVANLP